MPHLKSVFSNGPSRLRLGPLVSFQPSTAPRKRARLLPYHRLPFPVARVDTRYLQRSRRRRGGQVFHLTAKTAAIRPYQREHGSSLFPLVLVFFTSIVLSTPSHSFSPSFSFSPSSPSLPFLCPSSLRPSHPPQLPAVKTHTPSLLPHKKKKPSPLASCLICKWMIVFCRLFL